MQREERFVRIRRNVEDWDDPYLNEEKPVGVLVCRECRSVFADDRWQLEEQAKDILKNTAHISHCLCPACQKIHDRIPGGVVTISGEFVKKHEEEIVRLINNENRRAMLVNPLERIMDVGHDSNGLTVLTTNEKLAQRIGRALYKAYRGKVDYHWSEDTKLARVYWVRDV